MPVPWLQTRGSSLSASTFRIQLRFQSCGSSDVVPAMMYQQLTLKSDSRKAVPVERFQSVGFSSLTPLTWPGQDSLEHANQYPGGFSRRRSRHPPHVATSSALFIPPTSPTMSKNSARRLLLLLCGPPVNSINNSVDACSLRWRVWASPTNSNQRWWSESAYRKADKQLHA